MSQQSHDARRRRGQGLLGAALLALGLALGGAAPGPALAQTVTGTEGTIGVEVRKGLVVRLDRPAASVFVADPDIADVQAQSASMIYLFGRRAGTTSFYAVDENDEIVARRMVVVSHDLTRMRAAFDSLLPDAGVRVASIDGSIVLDGEVGSPAEADQARQIAARFLGDGEDLMNRLQVAAPTQVHLRVRVAEVGRDVTKQFGINWENIFRTGNFVFGFAQGRDVINDAGQFLRSPDGAGQIAGSFRSGSADINAIIDAFEREGLVNVLAEPNLTAISGETASFLAGGEFPIPVGVRDGEVTVQFKEFGVSLAFTPTVLSPSRISLNVRPEVSEITERGAVVIQGFTIPALATRRAETTVELASGQSFAIGGLLSTDVQSAVQKFPGLGDLPVLGTLFRSHNFQRNETELVILVTPYLVNPINATAAATPVDGFRAPSDVERILEGRLHRSGTGRGAGAAVGRSGARLVGPVGFVLE